MKSLSEKSQTLIEEANREGTDELSPADARRLRRRLAAAGIGTGASIVGTSAAASGWTWFGVSAGKWAIGFLMAATVSASAWWVAAPSNDDDGQAREAGSASMTSPAVVSAARVPEMVASAIPHASSASPAGVRAPIPTAARAGRDEERGRGHADVPSSRQAPKPQPAAGVAAPSEPSSASPSDLDTELALLRQAQQQLAEGSPHAALQAIRQYEQQVSAGTLGAEKDTVKAIAQCQLNRPEGQRLAERTLARWPRLPGAARLRQACGLEER